MYKLAPCLLVTITRFYHPPTTSAKESLAHICAAAAHSFQWGSLPAETQGNKSPTLFLKACSKK